MPMVSGHTKTEILPLLGMMVLQLPPSALGHGMEESFKMAHYAQKELKK